jgi:hypothetical protein
MLLRAESTWFLPQIVAVSFEHFANVAHVFDVIFAS